MTLPLLSTATRYFLAVARTGSISEAAGLVHVAPSAVSRQVVKLEEAMGCALFQRQARGMVMTEAGERLAAWARGTLEDTERVAEDLRGLSGQRAGRLNVACTEGFAAGFMPEAMATFRALHPEATIYLRVGAPHDVTRWLQRGEVECGLKFASAPDKGLRAEHAGRAPIMAVMAPTHALARRTRLTLAELVAHPLALPEPGTTVRQALDLGCSLLGLQYRALYCGNFAALLALAIRGEAPTLSSYLAVAHAVQAGQLVAVPVQQSEFERRRVLLLSQEGRSLPAAARAFIAHVAQGLQARPAAPARIG
jgi:DNA-binding transcriptional LysR family regulator